MIFDVYGPYKIDRKSRLFFGDPAAKKSFWEDKKEGLSSACGCYVFAKKAGRGIVPWYVGKTTARSFEKECFDYHKVLKYLDTIQQGKGTPVLFFIPKLSKTGKFVKSGVGKHDDISFLENLLIGAALERNDKLLNKRQTKMLLSIQVPGFLNSPKGKRNKATTAFAQLFGK